MTWPESNRPLLSTVPETITGTTTPLSSAISLIAYNAAFAFKVSKMVSTNKISAPPSNKPLA